MSRTGSTNAEHNVQGCFEAKDDASLPAPPPLEDWEAIADSAVDDLPSFQCLTGVSNLSLDDNKNKATNRRGRGPFLYINSDLCPDQDSDIRCPDDTRVDGTCDCSQTSTCARSSMYGTRHALVLTGLTPSTKTMELEKIFVGIEDLVVIRWINETMALAVFQSPSIALSALKRVKCPFPIHVLCDDDVAMKSISAEDLEPPRRRPETSARTAQRLIIHSMGMKMPSTGFGSRELRVQEETRRNRIATRHKLSSDAWGAG